MSKFFRNATAGALIALTPVTATVAAVRPNAAIPVASSVATAAQADDDGTAQYPWLPIGIIIAAIALGLYFAIGDNDEGQGSISRG